MDKIYFCTSCGKIFVDDDSTCKICFGYAYHPDKVILLNSAMMPESKGYYICYPASRDDFMLALKTMGRDKVVSYLGYESNVDFLESETGIHFPINRSETSLKNGDIVLVLKLKYRLKSPGDKGKYIPSPDDYEYMWYQYLEVMK